MRERSSGDNIFDTERQVLSKNPDGTLKVSVIKETYARVTLRGKRKSVDEHCVSTVSIFSIMAFQNVIYNHAPQS